MTFEGCRFADPHQCIDIRLGAIRVEGDHSRRERWWETAMLLHHAVAILCTNKTNEPKKHREEEIKTLSNGCVPCHKTARRSFGMGSSFCFLTNGVFSTL